MESKEKFEDVIERELKRREDALAYISKKYNDDTLSKEEKAIYKTCSMVLISNIETLKYRFGYY